MARERKNLGHAPISRDVSGLRPRETRRNSRNRQPRRRNTRGMWRPWRKVLVIALVAGAVVYGREVYVISRGALTGGSCSVSRVVDGDTVRLFCPGTGWVKARLTGYDTPEVFSPGCISEWWKGTQATWTLRKALWYAKDIQIVLGGQDRYGRRLASMRLDGVSVANLMINQGLARRYVGGQRSGWC